MWLYCIVLHYLEVVLHECINSIQLFLQLTQRR